MKIMSFKICPFVQRVTALLELKGADYDIEYINLSNKPQWFLDASPNGQVPILITDDGRVLFESDAIVEYIDEAIGKPILSSDPIRKAQERAWSYLATKHYLVQCSAQRSSEAGILKERVAKLNVAFSKIESQLGDMPFIGGDTMGMIDVAWTTLLHRTAIVDRCSGYDFLADFPRAQLWRSAVMATGIPQASVSNDFEDRFTAFYLAESTYLGQRALEKNGVPCTGACECTVNDLACCA